MLHNTQGIVLSFIKYRETSIICKIYTDKLGIQSYIINGVRKPSKKAMMAFYQPLNILDLIVYHKHNHSLNRIKDIKSTYPFHTIFLNPIKLAIGFFISEIAYKTIKEGEVNDELFDFLKYSLLELDSKSDNYDNFHVAFLILLAEHLGYKISTPDNLLPFNKNMPTNVYVHFEDIISNGYHASCTIEPIERREMLDNLLAYYFAHTQSLTTINSIRILQSLNQ
jgi:DNA repair protein RecO (recombination protein O)